MALHITNSWLWFCIAFGVMLIIALVMKFQRKYFYTNDVVIRKFAMIDLELPSSSREVVNIINGIFLLPPDQSQKTLRALKGQLYIDFIFMPPTYGAIFLLCMDVSWKMSSIGHGLFSTLAWLQVVAWLCDIIENIYLLNKIRPGVVASTDAAHKAYMLVEIIKWAIVLVSVVCSLFALSYFWLVGRYSYISLHYLIIILVEIILFIVAQKLIFKKSNGTAYVG